MNPPRTWPVRVGLALATLVYLAYSSFGIAAPFWWGHHGYHGATYMLRARMSLRLHMLTPATWTGFDQPPLNALYFHHPIGYHHILTLLIPIFGEHEWLARGVAVAGGLFALWALYALVRRCWSREAGLVAVVIYVCLPVVTSFSVLSDPMLPAFGCVCWSLNAFLQVLEKPSKRALTHAALAYGLGGLIMWESYFIAPFIALFALGYRFSRRGKTLRLGKWNALDLHTLVTGAVCTATMGFHLWFTHRSAAWEEFLQSYRLRHTPPSAQYVIERHTQWIEILFGMPLVVLAAAWLAVWIARLATGRSRRRDLAVLTFLYVNTIYIYMFAEGSSVHLYRVFFYSGFFTLATMDLIVDGAGAAARLGRGSRFAGASVGAALLAAFLVVEAPHAYANLLESRALMGTHSQTAYSPEQDKMLFAAEVTRLTRPSDRVIVQYRQLGSRKEFWYYLDRSLDEIGSLGELSRTLPTQPKSVLIVDEKQLGGSERAVFDQLIKKHPVTFYNHFALVDLRSQQPGARSFAFVPRAMSASYRWFVSHKYPPLALERIGYLPGLCEAVALGVPVARDEQLPPAPPAGEWRQQVCWHNYLIARGEPAGAIAASEKLATAGLTPVEKTLGGARVIAAGVVAGRLRVAILANGPEAGELRYQVRRPKIPPAIVPRSESLPPPGEWRAGYLYMEEVPLPGGAGAPSIDAQLWKAVELPKPTPPPKAVTPPPPGKPPLVTPGKPPVVAPGKPPLAVPAKPPLAAVPAKPVAPPPPPPPPPVTILSTVELAGAPQK